MKPRGHGLLSISLFIFAVPDGKRNGLDAPWDKFRFTLLLFTLKWPAHYDMPDTVLPERVPLDSPLFFFRGQGTESPTDQIFHGRNPPWNDFEGPHTTLFPFRSTSRAPIDVTLPIRLPMPDVDVMIQLSHTEKSRSITEGKADRNPIPEGAWSQSIILRVVLPL